MSSDPDPLTHVPGSDRRKPASSLPTVTPGKAAGEPSPEVQLSLKLATLETKLVNRVRSPEVSRQLIAFTACCWEALLCAATAADGY